MNRVRVKVTSEGLHQMHGTPVAGLIELINNALDADATAVAVTFERNDIGGLASVTVTDNGAGMTAEDLVDYFGPIGSSWKQHGTRFTTRTGRRLLGHKGRGRIGAFALGPRTTWQTTSVDVSDAGDALARKSFEWADDADEFDYVVEQLDAATATTGTQVTVTDVYPAADVVTSDQAFKEISGRLASYVVKYPSVSITVEGRSVNPADFIVRRNRLVVPMASTKTEDDNLVADLATAEDTAEVEVFEWSLPMTRELWFFDRPKATDVSEHAATLDPLSVTDESSDPAEPADVAFTLPARVKATGISFTAAVRWDGVPALRPTAKAGELSPAVARLKGDTEKVLREHMRRRTDENRRHLLDQWKSEGTYPYKPDKLTEDATQAEQDLFDVIAVAASPAFNHGDKRTRAFALELLKTTISSDATAVGRVLEKVLDLDAVYLAEIDELLQRVSLVSMIEISKEATKRVVFLDWLESILHDANWVKNLRERGGLQSIIENNAWVFGDQWQSLLADKGLRASVAAARDDDDPVTPEDLETSTGPAVRDDQGRIIRVDLLLARSMRAARRRQHLVIELKRPSRVINKADLAQVENYFDTIMKSPKFADPRIDWSFILVGRTFDDTVNRRRSQADREHGLVDTLKLETGATYQLWVRSWSEVIEDARSRLAFIKEHLSDFPDEDDLQALTDAHNYLLEPEADA